MIRTTPFHERTSALNESGLWEHWSGHLAATRYGSSEKFEYFAIRNAAGLFDTSPLYKYPGPCPGLTAATGRSGSRLPVGTARRLGFAPLSPHPGSLTGDTGTRPDKSSSERASRPRPRESTIGSGTRDARRGPAWDGYFGQRVVRSTAPIAGWTKAQPTLSPMYIG